MLFRSLTDIFVFTWNPYAIISFATALVMVILALHIFLWYRRGPGHTLYIFMVTGMALWAATEGLQRLAAVQATYVFWGYAGTLGWIFMLPLFVHFALLFTGHPAGKRASVVTGIYLPAVTLFILATKTNLIIDAQGSTQGAWGGFYPLTPFVYGVVTPWMVGLSVIALALFAKAWSKTREQESRRQFKAVMTGILVPIAAGVVLQVLLPLLGISILPLISVIMAFMATSVFFSIIRYRFFNITPVLAFSATLNSIQDAVIVVNSSLLVQFMNRAALTIFGWERQELSGIFLDVFFPPNTNQWIRFHDEVVRRLQRGHTIEHFETVLVDRDNHELPASISARPIVVPEAGNAPIGFVLVSRDIRGIQNILRELEVRSRELDSVKERYRRGRATVLRGPQPL